MSPAATTVTSCARPCDPKQLPGSIRGPAPGEVRAASIPSGAHGGEAVGNGTNRGRWAMAKGVYTLVDWV
jgi:hypothetical protein